MSTSTKAIRGFGWVSGAQYLTTFIRITGSIYLARKIDPSVFGQQGLAASVVALFGAFVMIGVQPAIIKQQKQVESYVQTLLFIRAGIVIILTSVLTLLLLLGWLPGSGNIQFYIILLFGSQLPSQITSVYVAYLTKEMYFGRLAVLKIIPSLVAVVLACLLAKSGYTIWALLWLFMAEQLVLAALTVLLVPRLFYPKLHKKLALDFFHYSKYLVGINLFERFYGQMDRVFIGSLAGEAQLGFYQRSQGLSGQLYHTTMAGLSTVTQPYFAKLQDERERLGKSFEFVGSFLVRASVFVFVCLAIILPGVILLVYGEKWLPSVPIFRLLIPFTVLRGFRQILRSAHQVAGSVKLLGLCQAIEVVFLAGLMYPMICWKGVFGAVLAMDISIIAGVSIMLYYFRSFANFSMWRIFVNPLIACLCGMLVVFLVGLAAGANWAGVNLWLAAAQFGLVYLAVLLVLEYSFIKQVLVLVYRATKPGA